VRFAKLALLASLALLVAAPVVAAPYRGECKRLTRQIARYERDARWADQRDDALWEDASKDRVAQLAERRADLCPQYRRRNPLAKAADFIASAAKAAAPYFIPGL
jgi:hypothetical protein